MQISYVVVGASCQWTKGNMLSTTTSSAADFMLLAPNAPTHLSGWQRPWKSRKLSKRRSIWRRISWEGRRWCWRWGWSWWAQWSRPASPSLVSPPGSAWPETCARAFPQPKTAPELWSSIYEHLVIWPCKMKEFALAQGMLFSPTR